MFLKDLASGVGTVTLSDLSRYAVDESHALSPNWLFRVKRRQVIMMLQPFRTKLMAMMLGRNWEAVIRMQLLPTLTCKVIYLSFCAMISPRPDLMFESLFVNMRFQHYPCGAVFKLKLGSHDIFAAQASNH